MSFKTILVQVMIATSTLGLAPGVFAITGGTDILPGNLLENHIVLLFNQKNLKFCTGTLLKRDVVITASHCLEEPYSDYIASMGADPYHQKTTRISVAKVMKLKQQSSWTEQQRFGDLALVKLSNSFAALTAGSEILLADEQWKNLNLSEYTAVGFGNEEELPKLQRVNLKLSSLNLGQPILIANEQMPKSVGHGDSGGPALIFYNNQIYIIGIASGKNPDSKASIYAGILNSKKWLLETLKNL